MLIIIFLGMILLSILGVWLKRRHRRKRDANTGNFGPRDAFHPSNPHSSLPSVQARGSRPEMATVNTIPPQGGSRFVPAGAGASDDGAWLNGKGKGKATVTAAPLEGGSAGGGGLAQNVKRKLSKRNG